jgi:hypothetical protein
LISFHPCSPCSYITWGINSGPLVTAAQRHNLASFACSLSSCMWKAHCNEFRLNTEPYRPSTIYFLDIGLGHNSFHFIEAFYYTLMDVECLARVLFKMGFLHTCFLFTTEFN